MRFFLTTVVFMFVCASSFAQTKDKPANEKTQKSDSKQQDGEADADSASKRDGTKKQPVLWVEAEDPKMKTAIKAAQKSFKSFARTAELENFRLVPAHDVIAIKAFFPDPAHAGRGEHIFLTDPSTDGKTVTATLNSAPNFKSKMKEGQVVTFPVSDISDWFLVTDGKGVGGFTIDVMYGQFSSRERKQLINQPPFVWYKKRLSAKKTAQQELAAVPACDKCGIRDLNKRGYKGATCGICVNGGTRCNCKKCGSPIIRFADQSHECHRCQTANKKPKGK